MNNTITMNDIEFCRACLIIDVKMYVEKKSHMLNLFSKLTSDLSSPLVLCYECATLLKKCESFRDKCIKASNLLKLIASSQSKISKDTLRVLDRKGYCLQSSLSLAAVEICEITIATNECNTDNNYKLCIYRSENVPIFVSDTIKNEGETTKTSKDIQLIKNNEGSKLHVEVSSSNQIKDLTQNESIESNALRNILVDGTSTTPFGTKDDLTSDKTEPEKIVETPEPLSRDGIKSEYYNGESSVSCNNSDGELIGDLNKRTACGTRRKRKQKFVIEDENKSYKTKRAREKKIMKDIENKSVDEITTIKILNKKKKLKLEKGKVKKKMEFDDDILYEGYMSVKLSCHENTQNKVSLRKNKSDNVSYSFECEICHEGFNSEDSHKEHMKRHSPGYGSFECHYCHKIFQKRCDLIKHHNKGRKYNYCCNICPFTSSSSHEAKAHVVLHNNEKMKLENGESETTVDKSINEKSTDDGAPSESNGKVCGVTRTSGPPFDVSYFEGYATFVVMTPEEARKEVLSRKETPNYMYSEFKCNLCFRGFEGKVTYDNHMKKHDPERGEHECEFCHLRFSNKRYLSKHKLGAHKRKFSCKICSFVCFCSDQAKVHVKLHKGTKYPCTECGEIFSMPNSLLMHKRKKHSTTVVCDLCGSTFNTERGLKSHKLLAHREETNPRLGPVCDLCDVHFANEAAWKKHNVLSAKHYVSNGCQHCGETFDTESALKTHARVHARKKRHPRSEVGVPTDCTMCGETLRDRPEWRNHLLTAHPDSRAALSLRADETPQCVCEICGKMFKKPCFLNYHMRVHTGEKPYTCDDCGKSYAYSGVLSEHRAMHASHPRHRCHLCPKTFKFKSALYKHIRAHLGIRPHKCHSCDKSFPTPCELRSHTHHAHYKVPWPKRERRRQRRPTQSTVRETSYEYDN